MKKSWNQATIQQYIDDGVEESRIIEYKAAEALDGTPTIILHKIMEVLFDSAKNTHFYSAFGVKKG